MSNAMNNRGGAGASTNKAKHVKVVIRTRPTSSFAQDIITFGSDKKSLHVHIPKNEEWGYINNQQENWDFKFDSILHNASQETVYDECAVPIVKSLLDGYNGTRLGLAGFQHRLNTHKYLTSIATILAYGQTGAGKTFTMTGATENYKHRGLIPRAISHVFREISDRPSMAFTVRISYLEVYNEQMIDLLETTSERSDRKETMAVVEDKNGSTSVKGLTLQIANSEEEALNYLFEGETNRSIAEHQLNKSSTRSHCIFTIHVESRSRVESSERVLQSKMNLVDLAGSERLSKTETKGKNLKEAMYINRSLTYLEQVILALSDKKRDHIPFRQSKMTHVLKDALGGNCNTLMIANVWGEKEHIEETISTLRFATRMMCVTINPELNVQYDPMALLKRYEKEIKELKQELSMHDTLSNRSHVQYETYTEAQRQELMKTVKLFLENEGEEIEIVSLRQIKETFTIFKQLYKSLQAEMEDAVQKAHKAVALAIPTDGHGDAAAQGKKGFNGYDLEKEDGVGEMEGTGFGVGLAAVGPKFQGGMAYAKGGVVNPGRTQATVGGPVKLAPINNNNKQTNAQRPRGFTSSTSGVLGNDNEEEFPASAAHLEGNVATDPGEAGIKKSDSIYLLDNGSIMPSGMTRERRTGAPLSRAEEFESYKRGRGAEMNRALTENKVTLRDKKKAAKDLAEAVNTIKNTIDSYRTRLDSRKADAGGSQVILNEEEYSMVNSLKSLRQEYQAKYDQLKALFVEIDYCTKVTDSCRQKLMTEFEQWYESIYGAQITDGGQGNSTGLDDALDIGEKFDRLQMERMSQEDPASLPYYNARKNTERRTLKVLKKPLLPAATVLSSTKSAAKGRNK